MRKVLNITIAVVVWFVYVIAGFAFPLWGLITLLGGWNYYQVDIGGKISPYITEDLLFPKEEQK